MSETMSAQELRRQRGYIKAKVTKIGKYIENVLNKRMPANIETIAVYADKLEGAYQAFNEIQRKLVCVVEEDELSAEDQREDDTFEDRYVELRATLSKWSAALKPAVSASNGSESLAHVLEQQTEVIRALGASHASSHTDNKVKLPTIKLPIFSGEIEDWKRFADTFTALIHNSELSAVQKYQYLAGAVTGSAARIIESIEISAQNYEVAWNLLKNRYDDPKALKRRHIQRLFEAPRVDRESAMAIQDLINHFQRHLRIVKSMESEDESWADSLILYMIEEKLDRFTRRRWEESNEGRRSISADLLFEFLQRRVQMLDRLGDSVSKGEPSVRGAGPRSGRANSAENSRLSGKGESRAPRSNRGNAAVSLATSTITGRCLVCNGPHLVYSCEQFLNLSAQERIDEVKRLKLCFNCLRNDHLVSACRASSCRRCAGRHNTLCHKDNERSHVEKPVVVNSETVSKEVEQGNNTSVSLSVQHAAAHTEVGQVLMSTAVVYIEDSRGFD